MQNWYLYVLRTRVDTLYTGITTDVERRLAEHAGSGRAGAKSLRARGPLELVYQVALGSRELASRAEYRLKQLSRQDKQAIIERQPGSDQLLKILNISIPSEETA